MWSIAWIMVEDNMCRCSKQRKQYFVKECQQNDKSGTRTHAPKVTGALNQHLIPSAILRVCFVVNSIDDGKKYHVPVFKIKETILCIGLSAKLLEKDSTHSMEVNGSLNQHLRLIGHLGYMF